MWELTHCSTKLGERIKDLLSKGWEPFAVVPVVGSTHDEIYFKREIQRGAQVA